MSKQNQPSHVWLVFNRLWRFLGFCFVVLIVAFIISVSTIVISIKDDCTVPYERNINVGSHWINVTAGNYESACMKGE